MTDNVSTGGDVLVILRHGPHGGSLLKEGLDAALVAAAFGKRVSLLFMGEGAAALVTGQTAGALGQKGTHATLAMLEMYDIETLLVEAEALEGLGLVIADAEMDVYPVSAAEVADQVAAHALVMTF
ncbi:DsrE family protein [Halomonas sp. V046]|uniref:DsrE family protein n=1 Tax=Halomonas sp. V046 TaxID=3459611 RepID=UPI00404458CF